MEKKTHIRLTRLMKPPKTIEYAAIFRFDLRSPIARLFNIEINIRI